MLSETNVLNYLAKVMVQQPEISVAFLKELQRAHIGKFSFNNLAVLLNENLSLNSQVLFERIVTNERGGYCFEHNKLFFEILESLDFECEMVLARVLLNRNIDVPRTHRITKVALPDSNYIVDVGFGSLCPGEPLLLNSEEPQNQGDVVYRIIQPHHGHYLLQMEEVDEWFTLYSFDNNLYTEADCLSGHHYSSTYPEAAFVNNLVVSLKSYDDIRSLRNGAFHHIRGGETEITHISSKDKLGEILTQEFGIELTSDQLSKLYGRYCKLD
jgi:N-hydroxyarylamine O-acetyltransferase